LTTLTVNRPPPAREGQRNRPQPAWYSVLRKVQSRGRYHM